MRKDYAQLVRTETGFELVYYRSWPHMVLRLLVWRLFRKSFDAWVVLRGFGKKIFIIGRLARAARKIATNQVFSDVYPEFPIPLAKTAEIDLLEYSFRVARLLDPALTKPRYLDIPNLRKRYEKNTKDLVVICPATDERRKTLDMPDVRALASHIKRITPEIRVIVLVRYASDIIGQRENDDLEIVAYRDLRVLLKYFFRSKHYYGADTGLYHLAAAMGMPTVVFFGPTQPHVVMMPEQPEAIGIRVAALGRRHCDVTTCQQPFCLSQAVHNYVGDIQARPVDLVEGCLLREFERSKWLLNRA